MDKSSTISSSQGYVTVAFGKREYFEMAVNLALSIKQNDPDRPICLIHKASETVPADIIDAFDDVRPFQDEASFSGNSIKLNIDKSTPYQETFFIDADCVILKTDMDRHWAKYGKDDFMIAGDILTEGKFSSLDVKTLMEVANIPYMINLNSGVMFFRKSSASARVFETARRLYHEKHEAFLEVRTLTRKTGTSDQPFLSAAMAESGLQPVSYTPEEGTIMATTYRARNVDFDIDTSRSFLEKPTGFRILGRFLAKGWVKHDTSIGHFINGEPKDVYQKVSDQLRDKSNWPRYEF